MQQIRPISDLRNKFAEVSRDVHETNEPVFLTKNGVGDMVVMSMESFAALEFDSTVYAKLQEAEREAEATATRYSSAEVLATLRETLEPQVIGTPPAVPSSSSVESRTAGVKTTAHV